MDKHPCPRWANCSAAFCPETRQGSHTRFDPICPRLPAKWIKDFPKDYRGAGPSEVMAAVARMYDKTAKAKE